MAGFRNNLAPWDAIATSVACIACVACAGADTLDMSDATAGTVAGDALRAGTSAGSAAAGGAGAPAGMGAGTAAGSAGAATGGSGTTAGTMAGTTAGTAASAGSGAGSGAGTGTAGTVAGTTAGAGTAGTGSTGQGCGDSDTPGVKPYAVKGTTVGNNGTFEDYCDADGNLVEHHCAMDFGCNAPPGADCAPSLYATGAVEAQTIDCFGRCDDGSCSFPCPLLDDEVVVTRRGTAAYEVVPASSGFVYVCTRSSDCSAGPHDGERLTVTSDLEGATVDCSGPFGTTTFPLTLSDGCSYLDCHFK